jgi:hypothetical protein
VNDGVIRATQTFELDQHHETIHDNPNELIEAGFPGKFLLPLMEVFESSESYRYFRHGQIVNEMIGIRHSALIYAIARHLGVPSSTASGFTGRGFAVRATIEAIRKVLDERSR